MLMAFLAACMRIDFLWANNFVIESDEAIVGLMARHIAAGADLPTFYYGQHYMGSLEPILVSFVFSIFGESSAALKSVPLAFSLILIVLVYLLALEVGGRVAARSAALFAAIAPSALTVWSAKARGGFVELVVIGALALLLTCKWLKLEKFSGYSSKLYILSIGLVLGLGWWVNNQIIYFMLPIAYVAFSAILWSESSHIGIARFWARLQLMFSHFLLALLGFFVGGLPFWIYNFEHKFVSFKMLNGAALKDSWEHLEGVFSTALPILLGGKRFWQNNDAFSCSSLIVWALYAVFVVLFLFFRRKQIANLFIFKVDRQQPLELFALFVLSCLGVFVFSAFGWLVQEPRYLLPIYVGLFVLTAWVVEQLWLRKKVLGLLLAGMMLVVNLASSYYPARAIPGEPFVFAGERVSKDNSELLNWLKERNYQWVRTNYWIGYRLAFETGEQVRFEVFQAPWQVRIPAYEEQAKKVELKLKPLVLVPTQAAIMREALPITGYSFKEVHLSGYDVLYDLEPLQKDLQPVERSTLTVSANYGGASAKNAIDGDINTRYGSAHPQTPGMRFEVELNPPQTLRGLRSESGAWPHDYPRGLSVEVELLDGSKKVLLPADKWKAVRYLSQEELSLVFEPVVARKLILTEHASESILDWSMAELILYR